MPKRVQTSVELNGINVIKFKDINYPRRKEKEIIINLPNETWKDIYDSANRAAIAVSGKNGCILMCCKRIKYNTYKGFIWRFIDDNDYSIKYKSKIIKIHNSIETIYNSVNEAAIKNNISASAIYNCLYGKSKTCGGYEWIKR